MNLGTDPLSSSRHNCWAVSNSCLGTPELAPSETNSRKKSTPRTDPYRKYGEHTSFGFIQLAQLFTKLLQALHPQPTSYRTPGHSAHSLIFTLRICPSIKTFTEISQTQDECLGCASLTVIIWKISCCFVGLGGT